MRYRPGLVQASYILNWKHNSKVPLSVLNYMNRKRLDDAHRSSSRNMLFLMSDSGKRASGSSNKKPLLMDIYKCVAHLYLGGKFCTGQGRGRQKRSERLETAQTLLLDADFLWSRGYLPDSSRLLNCLPYVFYNFIYRSTFCTTIKVVFKTRTLFMPYTVPVMPYIVYVNYRGPVRILFVLNSIIYFFPSPHQPFIKP